MDKKYRKGQTRIDFYLDDNTFNQMILLCKKHGLSKSAFLRKAIKHFIDINNITAKKGD